MIRSEQFPRRHTAPGIIALVAKSGRDKIQVMLSEDSGAGGEVLVIRHCDEGWRHTACPAVLEMIGALLEAEVAV